MPSSALLAATGVPEPSDPPAPPLGVGRFRALVGLDPLPLAVDVRGGPRDSVAEDVGVPPHDLRSDRGLDVGEVEDPGLGGELGVQDDLQPEVPQLAGQLERGARLERVVDLVGLLEQVLAQRRMRLLAIPRAAVGLAQPSRDPGHRPRTRHGELGGDRAEVDRGCEGRVLERSDRSAIVRPEYPDRMVGRVEPPEHGQRMEPGGSRASRQRHGRLARPGPEGRERDDQHRTRRFDRRRHESLAGDDLESVRGIEPPAEPRLRDERVEHRRLR